MSVFQYWILHNYSNHKEEENTLKQTVKSRCIKLTTIMYGPRSLGRGHHGPQITGYQRGSTTTYEMIIYVEYAAYKTKHGST